MSTPVLLRTPASSPSWARRHTTGVWLGGAAAGPVVAGLLSLGRPAVHDNHATLLLVLAVALVAATGLRGAGILAALTAGLGYDYFWTLPYGSLAIADPADVATVGLLVVVSLAAGGLRGWVDREHASAARRGEHLAALELAAGGGDAAVSTAAVCRAITTTLGADRCTW